MPKVKTKKAITKRFKLTATGKLMRRKPGCNHILTKKSPKRKRRLHTSVAVSTAHLPLYKRLANVA